METIPWQIKANQDKKEARGLHIYQQVGMIEWLEQPANLRLIIGAAQRDVGRVVAGAKSTKEAAHSDLMSFVNQKCSSKWTKDQGGYAEVQIGLRS